MRDQLVGSQARQGHEQVSGGDPPGVGLDPRKHPGTLRGDQVGPGGGHDGVEVEGRSGRVRGHGPCWHGQRTAPPGRCRVDVDTVDGSVSHRWRDTARSGH